MPVREGLGLAGAGPRRTASVTRTRREKSQLFSRARDSEGRAWGGPRAGRGALGLVTVTLAEGGNFLTPSLLTARLLHNFSIHYSDRMTTQPTVTLHRQLIPDPRLGWSQGRGMRARERRYQRASLHYIPMPALLQSARPHHDPLSHITNSTACARQTHLSPSSRPPTSESSEPRVSRP